MAMLQLVVTKADSDQILILTGHNCLGPTCNFVLCACFRFNFVVLPDVFLVHTPHDKANFTKLEFRLVGQKKRYTILFYRLHCLFDLKILLRGVVYKT